jgi:hypothetical protein
VKEDDFEEKLHKKCRQENRRLRTLLKNERHESKRLSGLAARKTQKLSNVIKILSDCIDKTMNYNDDTVSQTYTDVKASDGSYQTD